MWWIRWNTNRVFFSRVESASDASLAKPFKNVWKGLGPAEETVLLQVTREAYRQPETTDGREPSQVRSAPAEPESGASPRSQAVQFLGRRETDLQEKLRQWEQVNVGHSWRYVRAILGASVAALACFLIATQPGLQSSLLAMTTGITAALTTLMKMRDVITAWLMGRKEA